MQTAPEDVPVMREGHPAAERQRDAQGENTKQSESLRYRTLPLRGGAGTMPALGFGTLIPDAIETRNATRTALEAGFRHCDCSERYRNEEQVGQAIREALQAGLLSRKDLFITTKLWNNNHRPERVQPAIES